MILGELARLPSLKLTTRGRRYNSRRIFPFWISHLELLRLLTPEAWPRPEQQETGSTRVCVRIRILSAQNPFRGKSCKTFYSYNWPMFLQGMLKGEVSTITVPLTSCLKGLESAV